MNVKTDLSLYNNSWYKPGGSLAKRILWFPVNAFIFNSVICPISSIKVILLRFFGAKVGKGVVIKPSVSIKYPWNLSLGNNVWVGENSWFDNLGKIAVGDNCCISQGALLLCGNHNFGKEAFDLMVKEIVLEDGVWIGAKSVVSPGVICHSHSVLTVNSVATTNLDAFSIYQGNPAVKVKERVISNK
jgi:putative colanic acid biosynthesis acetyltransferase WcaF